MRRYRQMTIYFMIFAAGVATGSIWNISRSGKTAELQEVVDQSHRGNSALQAQARPRQAERVALRGPLVAPLATIESPAAVSPGGPGRSQPIAGPSVGGSSGDQDELDPDKSETLSAAAETALARFNEFIEETAGMRRRERGRHVRKLVQDLRKMGRPAVTALLHVLEERADWRERRLAVGLLGALQDPSALPALQGVLQGDEDIMMRRAAVRSLRRLRAPEAIPVLESALNNPQEDAFVRIQAAQGLARLGETRGANGLLEIFAQTPDDGRAHSRAFRALTRLNDPAALPVMRQVANSGSDVSDRVRAVRFLGRNGGQEDLALLEKVLSTRDEQESMIAAAQKAYEELTGGQPPLR